MVILGAAWAAIAYPAVVPHGRLEAFMSASSDTVLRSVLSMVLSVVLIIGPGCALRKRLGVFRGSSIALLPLPGLVGLAVIGALLWWLGPLRQPQLVAVVLVAPVLLGVTIAAALPRNQAPMTTSERRVFVVLACALLVVLGKGMWSLGPTGELYAGLISRTLEVGDRPDSRIPFHVVQLVANGLDPYSIDGRAYFLPYNFSERGPFVGLAASPAVLLSGATVPLDLPNHGWAPFDAQGFAAYRDFMGAAALTVLLFPLFGLLRLVRHERAALYGVLLAALTPFVMHEAYFTWPKLVTTSLMLVAAVLAAQQRWWSCGWVVGIAYLCHPSALLAVPTLALWIAACLHRGNGRRLSPRGLAAPIVGVGVPLALIFVAWRLVNGANYAQSNFLQFFFQADTHLGASVATWLGARAVSLGNTVIPFYLPSAHSDYGSINEYQGQSPGVVHFFFQYWCSLPFAVAFIFFPLLVLALLRLLRQRPALTLALAIVPLLLFTVYWGSATSGMLREGLHTWVVTLLALYAWQRYSLPQPNWTPRLERLVLPARGIEVLAMLVVPTLATRRLLVSDTYGATDTVALLAMGMGVVFLAVATSRFLSSEGSPQPPSAQGGEEWALGSEDRVLRASNETRSRPEAPTGVTERESPVSSA